MTADYTQIAREIRAYLNEHNIPLSEVASRLNCSPQAVSNQLSGRKLGENVARRWSEVFGFDIVYLMTGEGQLLRSSQIAEVGAAPGYSVKLVPQEARGGSLGDFTEGAMSYQCERIASPIKNVDLAISVTGDSMSPEFPSGSIVLVKKVNENIFLQWGQTYVLDTPNGAVIKQIRKTENPKEVECVSVNPAYQPFRINTDYVLGWYKVLMVIIPK